MIQRKYTNTQLPTQERANGETKPVVYAPLFLEIECLVVAALAGEERGRGVHIDHVRRQVGQQITDALFVEALGRGRVQEGGKGRVRVVHAAAQGRNIVDRFRLQVHIIYDSVMNEVRVLSTSLCVYMRFCGTGVCICLSIPGCMSIYAKPYAETVKGCIYTQTHTHLVLESIIQFFQRQHLPPDVVTDGLLPDEVEVGEHGLQHRLQVSHARLRQLDLDQEEGERARVDICIKAIQSTKMVRIYTDSHNVEVLTQLGQVTLEIQSSLTMY